MEVSRNEPGLEIRRSGNPFAYLKHSTYREYQNLPKTYPSENDAVRLEKIADRLANEVDPHFLNAAASAYLESAIARNEILETDEKMALLSQAQLVWECALRNEEVLRDTWPETSEYTAPYRIAMNLACLPMVKGLFLGDVKPETITESVERLIQIGDVSEVQKHLALKEGNHTAFSHHIGMQHEINALITLLHKADSRFIAFPSSDRAGSGFTHKEQTHDITLISQHFGEVRNIIPVEVKASASRRDRERYKALIIRGKMHLSAPHESDPTYTRDALRRYIHGEQSEKDMELIDSIQATVSGLIAKYKQGGKYKPLEDKESKTNYYNSLYVAPQYVGPVK